MPSCRSWAPQYAETRCNRYKRWFCNDSLVRPFRDDPRDVIPPVSADIRRQCARIVADRLGDRHFENRLAQVVLFGLDLAGTEEDLFEVEGPFWRWWVQHNFRNASRPIECAAGGVKGRRLLSRVCGALRLLTNAVKSQLLATLVL
jgi:hypothetical protein